MDAPGSAYKLLLSYPSGLSRSQVLVDFRASYDRIPHPDTNLEKFITEIWSRRIEENPSMYNGEKFRYGGCTSKSMDGSRQNSVCLNLGLTDYRRSRGADENVQEEEFEPISHEEESFQNLRTFVGTNLNPLWENFLVPSEDDTIRCQHMASPLGNGAIVETSDKRILVLQRSFNVGEFPGYFVFPGGHSEPKEIGISSHPTDGASTDSVSLNEKVAEEMFDGIIREVVEEIGVPASSLTDPLFIGISCRELNVRPTAFFFLRCNLESDEIHQLYSNAQDGYESTQLYAMSRSDIDSVTLKIPGCHRGGYALYELMTASEDA